MTKSARIRLILILAIVTLVIGVLFATQSSLVAYAVNYAEEISVSNDVNGGYIYGNGGQTKTANTLQEVFDDILLQDITSNAIVRFNNVDTTDKIVLNCSRRVVILGSVDYTGSSMDTFITVDSGSLTLIGAFLSSSTSNLIRVNADAELNLQSGTVSVDGELDNQSITATIINNGKIVIEGGVIIFNATGNENVGSAIEQAGSKSQLIIEEGDDSSVEVSGNNALKITGGTASIDGGTYNATIGVGASNGNALALTNNASVTIKDGVFQSVAKEKTIELLGGNNSSFNFEGGSVVGKVLFGKRASYAGTEARVNGRTILPNPNGYVSLFSTEEYLTKDNAKLQVNAVNGYYCVGWDGNANLTPSVSDFALGATITPVLSNVYEIVFVVNGEEIIKNSVYGASINPTNQELGVAEGYEIEEWRNESDEVVQNPFIVSKNAKYTAKLKISIPQISVVEDYEKDYDGADASFNARVIENEFDYDYEWQIKDETWQTVQYGKTLTLKTVSDSGLYRLKVVVSDGVLTEQIGYSNEFSVTINKGEYQDVTHGSFEGVYDSAKKLNVYVLDEYFAWANDQETPTVPKKEYKAVYCADSENYNAKEVWITINLQKAPAVPKSHPTMANSYVYDVNKTLKDYPFAVATWRWSDESIVPNAGGSSNYYGAYYNPDRDNYEDYYTQVALVIGKADYNDIPDLRFSIQYASGITGSKINEEYKDILGFYKVANASLGALLNGVREFILDASYNADSLNYNDYTNCKIIVTVTKGSNSVDYNSDNTIDGGEYSPSKTLADVSLSSHWRWAYPTEVPVVTKTKYLVIYNPNEELYEDFYLEVTLIISKATIVGVTHATLSGIYGETQTLADFTLESGWSWIDESVVPTVNVTQYSAVLDKGENYNLYYADVTLKLSKATYDLSSISFVDTSVVYDGTEHGILISGTLPNGVSAVYYNNAKINAGKYVVQVEFVVSDTINYNRIQPRSAVLTILKAQSQILVEDFYRYVYDRSEHLPSATVDNDEQTIKISCDVKPKEIGEHQVKYYVTESANYLYAEKIVRVQINPISISISGVYGEEIKSFMATIANEEVGMDASSVLSAEITSITNQRIEFKLLLDGEAKVGNYKVLLLLPDGITNVDKIYRAGEPNVAIDHSISGNYVIFSVSELGEFVMVAGEKWSVVSNAIEWWGWLLISLAIVIVIAGISVGLVFAYKKGKLPIEQFRKLFVIKKHATPNAEVEVVLGEENEE